MTTKQKIARGTRVQSEGKKRPFTAEQGQLIRANLEAKKDVMQLALFETALCTCLRASDLLALTGSKVADIDWSVAHKIPVKQKKTGDVVLVRLSQRARVRIGDWVEKGKIGPAFRLFDFSRQYYGRLVKEWARMAHVDPKNYSTHSMRRTHPTHVYNQTKNVKAAQEMLGHSSIAHTGAYLGMDTEAAHHLAEEHDL